MTRTLSRSFLLSSLLTLFISACGGGGSTTTPDTTPNSFSFEDGDSAQPGDTVESGDTIVVRGINRSVPITIINGEYSVDGGTYTGSEGTIQEGQSVTVRLPVGANFSTIYSTTLTIGGVSAEFSVTTIADNEPDPIGTPSVGKSPTAIARDESVLFDAFTVSGIEGEVTISIEEVDNTVSGKSSGFEIRFEALGDDEFADFEINGSGEFVRSATVSSGDSVVVRITAPGSFSSVNTAQLTIGSVTQEFSVEIAGDNEPEPIDPVASETPTSVVPGDTVQFAAFTVEGIVGEVAISIESTGGGDFASFQINGSGEFVTSGMVSSGDEIVVRVNAPDSFEQTNTAQLSVGSVTQEFSISIEEDLVPELALNALEDGVALNSDQISSAVLIEGINNSTPISIIEGQYSINGGDFTVNPGTVEEGDAVRVFVTASSEFSTAVVATITVGGVEGTYTVTTLARDDTPEPFHPGSATTGVELETLVNFTSFDVSGLNDIVDISIDAGSFSINGGAARTSGSVENGNSVVVSLTSSPSFSTAVNATLTIGALDGVFSLVTEAQDTVPEQFGFVDPEDNVALNSGQTSSAVLIEGINSATPISITGGQYSINGGEFTVNPGTVEGGDEVRVFVTASSEFSTAVVATITVGGVEGTYTVTTLARDDTPEPFHPGSATTGVELETLVNFTSFDVSGLNDIVDISIDAGSFSINGGAASTSGSVENGDSVVVSLTSSPSFSTTVNATLTIGALDGVFSLVTEAQDTVPDQFGFVDTVGVGLSTITTAFPITVSGINYAAPISIENGMYRIQGDIFYTSEPGTITNGQTVSVQATSASTTSTTVDVVLTIGGVQDTYSLTTLTDVTPPTAEFVFPTPVTATEGLTLTVRGTAEDDYSDITSITVNVRTSAGTIDSVAATSLGDNSFAEWSAEVDLGADEVNTITVEATDSEENTLAEIATVSVTHQSTAVSFPNSDNRLENVSTGAVSLDARNNRLVVADADSIYSVDLNTGARTELIDAATMPSAPEKVHVDVDSSQIYISSVVGRELMLANADGSDVNVFSDQTDGLLRPYGLERSAIDGLLYVTDDSGSVHMVDTVSGALTREIFFDDNFTLNEPRGLAVVAANTILVADQSEQSLFSVDISLGDGRGAFTEILGLSVLVSPQDVEYDDDENRAIFVDSGLDAVMSVPVVGGSHTVISDATTPNANNVLIDPSGVALDGENNLVYILSLDGIVNDVILVDLVSGERVVLSRSVDEPD